MNVHYARLGYMGKGRYVYICVDVIIRQYVVDSILERVVRAPIAKACCVSTYKKGAVFVFQPTYVRAMYDRRLT